MLKEFIKAARLRTLPLSISGILVGSFAAFYAGYKNYTIFVLAILTTIGFQIVSNFANDYGDGIKGTDNKDRIGPERGIQSGKIQPSQMKNAIVITGVITFIIALILIYKAFGKENFAYSFIFILLGIASIVAAVKYTVGKNAYGYTGLGDLFVFLFFGLLSTIGSYFLYTKQVNLLLFFPATSIGLLSAAVLNLNNMRDIENDKKSNKNTLVVKIGSEKAKYYHYFLLAGSLLSSIIYSYLTKSKSTAYIYLIAYFFIAIHFIKVIKINIPKEYDPELKKVALSTFLFALLFGIGLLLQ